MEQPDSFVVPREENKMCRSIKSLYDLKQAPKVNSGMKILTPLNK